MQAQATCRFCGTEFDPTVDYQGAGKGRRSGRPRQFCSMRCRTAFNNAKPRLGGARAWPRSEEIEQEVCARYMAGESCNALASAYGVNNETVRRVLQRNNLKLRSRNGPRKGLKGGRIMDQQGYVCVLIYPNEPFYADISARGPGGYRSTGSKYVPEHRLVMSRAIGRAVSANETVHHKNGIKTDNRIENLELWASVHHKGQRVEDLIAFVVENYPVATRAALDGRQLSLNMF